MRKRFWRDWLMAALGGLLALGCEKGAVKPDLPPDPVLMSKRPVEGKPSSSPVVVVRNEPITPTLPESALAHAPPTLSHVARTTAAKPLSPPLPGPQLEPPKLPNPTVPVTPEKTAPQPISHRPVGGTFGHAPDYVWLQGVLDRHYSGHVHLRFCDASVDDEWGGKVCLAEDARLQPLKSGDGVFVEGELVKENGQPKRTRGDHYPLYRIRTIEKVSSKP